MIMNDYVSIAFLIIIVFICVYAIVSRICKAKEAKYTSELMSKMYKEWLELNKKDSDSGHEFTIPEFHEKLMKDIKTK